VDGAHAVFEVVLGVVGLAAHAVQALVGLQGDVAVVVAGLQQLLDRVVMARFAGADEIVVGDVELLPRFLEAHHSAIGPLDGSAPVLFGSPLHLEAVLIGAGQEHDVATAQPIPASDRVSGDRRVRVPDVGGVVDVVDRRRDVVGGHRFRVLTSTNAARRNSRPARRYGIRGSRERANSVDMR